MPKTAPKSAPVPPSAFAGFGPRALDFFKALAFHQDKGWFAENRVIHDDEVRRPFGLLIADLSAAFADEGLPLRGDPKTSLFRLHRDTRFAKDKKPFKTNAGAVLSRDGTKRAQGFLYVHLDPEGCFAAAGFYRPEPDEVLALRRRIADRPQDFRQMAGSLGGAGLDLAAAETLTRLPKGFEELADPEIGSAIRLKSLLVREAIPAETVFRPDLRDRLVAFALRAEPLLRFGWRALDEGRPASAPLAVRREAGRVRSDREG